MKELEITEMAIIAKKEKRSGKRYNISFVEYRKPTYRTTLCLLATSSHPLLEEVVFGEAILKENDIDNQPVGAVIAFVKALNSM